MDIIEKIKKIKELSEKGIGGEALNAKKILSELIEKYNITEEELIQDKKTDRSIYTENKRVRRFLFQCIAKLFGSESDEWKSIYHFRKNEKNIHIKISNQNYILLNEYYSFHKYQFLNFEKKQIELYREKVYQSYLEVHDIFDLTPKNLGGDIKKVDPSDIIQISNLIDIARKETKSFHKSINKHNE